MNLPIFTLVVTIDKNYERYAELLAIDIHKALRGRAEMFLTLITFVGFQGKLLENLAESLKIGFNHYQVPLDLEGFQFGDHGHISKTAYLKFFIADACPQDTRFCLYVDPDVLVTGDPLKFLDNLPTSILSAWSHPNLYGISPTDPSKRILAFANGLMLINLDAWRQNSFTLKLLKVFQEFPNELDGDIFNLTFEKHGLNWDIMPAFLHQIRDKGSVAEVGNTHPVIVHFEGASKPWNTPFGGKYEREWRRRFKQIYPNFKIGLPEYYSFFKRIGINFIYRFFLQFIVLAKKKIFA
jgi:lipopolysaccharide biosynthesis glycosyltransferase